ncbi:hypothetical protein LTR16_006092 [Cryomyces antarcticus]|uniref:Survival Motor Neuron Gemin2-binding domain-containing protein n=1 Tax=Cryomyces antarcticus TaxID=329879 RepID=A0ABR0LW95_9PEZI|nr:hypothetical protein LTR04_003472 [Oleoguttula sp. CCFEE 6159]KAK5249864.1 hypothetical protein LTR16_006092 [Cryomyces antarcticus]
MSHNEVWDDSALLESWDEAVQEYKHYHSIHARGENVEEVVHEAEQAETGDKIMNGDEAAPDTGVNAVEELETGDLPNGQAEGGAQGSSHTVTTPTIVFASIPQLTDCLGSIVFSTGAAFYSPISSNSSSDTQSCFTTERPLHSW